MNKKRKKELEGLIRDAAELSDGTMPLDVIVFDGEELAYAKEWMKGKKGMKKLRVKIGDAVSEHVDLSFLD